MATERRRIGRGEKRSNDTHESNTDPESRLNRKSNAAPALPSYVGHVITDNRHGLVVNVQVTTATGTAEREAAVTMLGQRCATAHASRWEPTRPYDIKAFVRACRDINVTPHVAQNITHIGACVLTSAEN